jgi:cytoskeletal protein CcmA (bactofilin family)
MFTRKPDQNAAPLTSATPHVPVWPVWPAPQPTTPAVVQAPQADAMASVIGNDLLIEGQSITIRCQGALQVNGNIRGDLHSRKLVVGPDAVILGSIAANDVEVFGSVHGTIYGTHVVLQTSAKVDGDIHSQHLQIKSGASFDGRSRNVADGRDIAPKLEPETVQAATGAVPSPMPMVRASSPAIVTPPRDRLHS